MTREEITARLMQDPIAGPELRKQAAGQPFDSFVVNKRMDELGLSALLQQGDWISGGKAQHESKKVDNFGKAMLYGSGAAVGGYGLKAATAANNMDDSSYIGRDVAGVDNAASGGGGMASGMSGSLPRVAGALAPMVMSAMSGRGGGQGLEQAFQQFPELRQMLDLQTQQAQRQDPLHKAAIQLAMNLMPKSSFSAFPGREIK